MQLKKKVLFLLKNASLRSQGQPHFTFLAWPGQASPIYVPRLARPRSLACKCCTDYLHTCGGSCRWPPRGTVRKTRGRKPGACTAAWSPCKSGTLHLRRPTSDPSVLVTRLRSLRRTFRSGC
jgi:hypothetical protein